MVKMVYLRFIYNHQI